MATIGSVTIGMKVETKEFDKQISDIEHKIKVLTETIEKKKELGLTATEIKQYEIELEKTKNKLIDIKQKKADINKQPIDNDGPGGFGGIIKKITKIGLGLIGLRTGIALLRSTVRTVADQNDEIATKLNTIKSVLANALTPVVTFIVNLFAKLIAYVSYILNGWFKWDILSNKTAKNTKKMKNNIGGANKEAAKLKRTLAGFDEMNILQKDGGVSTGGGGGGISPDDIDMSMFDKIEIPDWVKWIADNKDTILAWALSIGTVLTGLWATFKSMELVGTLSKISSLLGDLSKAQIFGIVAGFAITVAGIIQTIMALTSETVHLEEVLGGVSTILIGIGIIVASFSPWGWVSVGIGLLGEVITALVDTRTDEEKLQDAADKLATAQQNVNKAYQDFVNAQKTQLNAYKSLQKAKENVSKVAKQLGIDENKLNTIGEDLYEGIRNGTIDINTLKKGNEDLTETYGFEKEQLLTIYETYLDVKDSEAQLTTATDKLTNSQKNYTEEQKKAIQENLRNQLTIFDVKGEYEDLGKAMNDAYMSGASSADELAYTLAGVLNRMDEETAKIFTQNLPAELKIGIASMDTFKSGLASFTAKDYIIKFGMNTSDVTKKLDELKKKINSLPTNTLTIALKKATGSKNGSVLLANGGMLGLPRLAPGGIVNHPGPGINYRGANIGERGAEAVVPLTNSQMMSQLGETIARYVKIKAEVPVYVGNRQISREIRNINAEEDFAYNGG